MQTKELPTIISQYASSFLKKVDANKFSIDSSRQRHEESLEKHRENAKRALKNKSSTPSLGYNFTNYESHSGEMRIENASSQSSQKKLSKSKDKNHQIKSQTSLTKEPVIVLRYLKPNFDIDAHNRASNLPPIISRQKLKQQISERKRTKGRSLRQ